MLLQDYSAILTLSSPDRKVTWLLWHYSEAPQKARNFLGLRETFCYAYYSDQTANSFPEGSEK